MMGTDNFGLIFIVAFLCVVFVLGASEYAEDTCIWQTHLKIINCDKKSITSLQFRSKHPGYTMLSLKSTHLQRLDFNSSYLPDLEVIDARRTVLNCQRINPNLLGFLDRVIVDEKSCLNSICCRKLQIQKKNAPDIEGGNYIKESKNSASSNTKDSSAVSSYHIPSGTNVTSEILTKNETKTIYNFLNQEVRVNSIKSQSGSISVSTQVKINYGENMSKRQPEKTKSNHPVVGETDLTVVYAILGLLGVISVLSLCFSVYGLCVRRRQRTCSIRDFMPISSAPSRSRSQGTVIL